MNRKTKSKNTTTRRMGKGFRIYSMLVLVLSMLLCLSVNAFAAEGDPITVVNNLSNFIFGLIRAVGLIILGWGVVQIGLSFQSHDPSQRSNGFLTLAGGVVITFAKEILSLITG
ncbi:MAG: glutamyl-tRNA amidotransferase [Oscillospiraceae bacterium]|nr:glutamyl-tRNA amidotransferase [Oscillospiraceae bacterium]